MTINLIEEDVTILVSQSLTVPIWRKCGWSRGKFGIYSSRKTGSLPSVSGTGQPSLPQLFENESIEMRETPRLVRDSTKHGSRI